MGRVAQTARQFVQYHERVLATDPIAYWVLDEKSGAVAYDLVSGRVAGAQNGAHVGVTLGRDGIGDGRTSPFYDGANDFTNVFSAALAGAFNGAEGTVLIWGRVNGAGVWTDGAWRRLCEFNASPANRVIISKHLNNNTLTWAYQAGGVIEIVNTAGYTTTDWFCMAMSWSAGADAVIPYFNGVPGATMATLGVWAGALSNTNTIIGAENITPITIWNGTLAHCALWDRALPAAPLADLAVVE